VARAMSLATALTFAVSRYGVAEALAGGERFAYS
jgi:hypothetical protein